MPEYYFQVEAREGPPGFADDSVYRSKAYRTLAGAYYSLCDFDPLRHWPHLRHVSKMELWMDDNDKVNVSTGGDYMIAVTDLAKLNSTEEEFLAIIDEYENMYSCDMCIGDCCKL